MAKKEDSRRGLGCGVHLQHVQNEDGDKHVDACRNYTLTGVGVLHQARLDGGDQEDDHGRLHEGQFYFAALQKRIAKDDDSAVEAALAMFKNKKPKSEKKKEPKKPSGSTDGTTGST